jgi:cytochrome c peroxidase
LSRDNLLCATCHKLKLAFTDDRATSVGVGNRVASAACRVW